MRKKLKEIRITKKLTQEEMACRVGLLRTSYTNIETGMKNPSETVAQKITEVLGYRDKDLFVNEPDERSDK